METKEFTPNWATPPGESLADILEERGITQKELSIRLGRSEKNLSQAVSGNAPITAELAIGLERVLGTPAAFWMRREARYREALYRQEAPEPSEDDLSWAKSFPYTKMAEYGWVQPAKEARDRYMNLLKFFGVASRAAYIRWQESQVPMYRRSLSASSEKDHLAAAWLRQGQLEASEVETEPYSEKAFHAAVKEARSLTCSDPQEFEPALKKLFADAGAALLFIRELPSMGVSGATQWLKSKAVIQITLRYKTNDQFWFTVFHESCHILKHQKRLVFLETGGDQSIEEAEANTFAADLLIPPDQFRMFVRARSFDEASVRSFAQSIEVCPGVVVGRLQREGLLPYSSPLNKLKVRLDWTQVALEHRPSARP